MTPCTRFADAIDDVALGARPERTIARHLASCAGCADRLERRRVLARRIDAALIRAAGAEPSPGFVERVTARASQLQHRQWRLAFDARVAVAFAAAVLLVATIAGWQTSRRPNDLTALNAWRSPTASLLISHSDVLSQPFTPRSSI